MNIAIIDTTGDSYSRIIFILCNDTFKCATGNINLNFSCIGSTVVLRISFINSSSTGKDPPLTVTSMGFFVVC